MFVTNALTPVYSLQKIGGGICTQHPPYQNIGGDTSPPSPVVDAYACTFLLAVTNISTKDMQATIVSHISYKLNEISQMSLQQTPVKPSSVEHFLKCLLTCSLRLNGRSHKPQENCLYSECIG